MGTSHNVNESMIAYLHSLPEQLSKCREKSLRWDFRNKTKPYQRCRMPNKNCKIQDIVHQNICVQHILERNNWMVRLKNGSFHYEIICKHFINNLLYIIHFICFFVFLLLLLSTRNITRIVL